MNGKSLSGMKIEQQTVPSVVRAPLKDSSVREVASSSKGQDFTALTTVSQEFLDLLEETMDPARPDTKLIWLIRGLPGSGKTITAAQAGLRYRVPVMGVDDLSDATQSTVNLRIIEMLLHFPQAVIIEGVFPTTSVVDSIFAAVCDYYPDHNVLLQVSEMATDWAHDVTECWVKTLEREYKTASPSAIRNLCSKWEPIYAQFYRHRTDPAPLPGLQ